MGNLILLSLISSFGVTKVVVNFSMDFSSKLSLIGCSAENFNLILTFMCNDGVHSGIRNISKKHRKLTKNIVHAITYSSNNNKEDRISLAVYLRKEVITSFDKEEEQPR